MTRRTARLVLAIPLLVAMATAFSNPAAADDIGDDEIVVAGLKRSALADRCKVTFLAKSDGDWKGSRVWVTESGRGLYVLSSRSAWYERAKADRDVILRLGDDDYAVAARAEEDDAQRDAVDQALKDKCGFFWYGFRSLFTFWRTNHVMRIVPRPRGH